MMEFAESEQFLQGAINFILKVLSDWIALLLGMLQSRAASSAEILSCVSSWPFIGNFKSSQRDDGRGPVFSGLVVQWFEWREALVTSEGIQALLAMEIESDAWVLTTRIRSEK
jgi:hypothetical protein